MNSTSTGRKLHLKLEYLFHLMKNKLINFLNNCLNIQNFPSFFCQILHILHHYY